MQGQRSLATQQSPGKPHKESEDEMYSVEFIKRVRAQEAIWLQVLT